MKLIGVEFPGMSVDRRVVESRERGLASGLIGKLQREVTQCECGWEITRDACGRDEYRDKTMFHAQNCEIAKGEST